MNDALEYAPIYDGTVLNTGEQAPESFFIFVKADNFLAQRNLEFGMYTSSAINGCMADETARQPWVTGRADFLPRGGWPAISPFAATSGEGTSRLGVQLERFRQANFRFLPSRLSAVFAFGDMASCLRAAFTHGWDLTTVREFQLQPLPINRVARVNMEMITHARYMEAAGTSIADDRICLHYWSGSGNFEYSRSATEGRVIHEARAQFGSTLLTECSNQSRKPAINPSLSAHRSFAHRQGRRRGRDRHTQPDAPLARQPG